MNGVSFCAEARSDVFEFQKERKENLWDAPHRLATADARRLLSKHESDVGGASEKLVWREKLLPFRHISVIAMSGKI